MRQQQSHSNSVGDEGEGLFGPSTPKVLQRSLRTRALERDLRASLHTEEQVHYKFVKPATLEPLGNEFPTFSSPGLDEINL
jgi:hypothetical protein